MQLIALVLLGTFSLQVCLTSSMDAENVANYIGQYVLQRMSRMRFMRSGGGQQCYDKYIPQISEIAERGKNETQLCNTRAESRKQDELLKVEQQREQISRHVEGVLNWLQTCSANENVVDYLRCLKNDGATNLNYVNQIVQVSTNVSEKIESSVSSIDLSENTCIAAAIAKAKQESDELFAVLQRCLINGFDDPQLEPETDPSPEPEPEPEPEPQPEPQTETPTEQPQNEENSDRFPEEEI